MQKRAYVTTTIIIIILIILLDYFFDCNFSRSCVMLAVLKRGERERANTILR